MPINCTKLRVRIVVIRTSVAHFLHRVAPRRERHTCYLNLVSGLSITEEVTADTLLLRIFLSCLRVHIHGAPDTKAGSLPIELVAISCGCNRVKPDSVGLPRPLRVLTLQSKSSKIKPERSEERSACSILQSGVSVHHLRAVSELSPLLTRVGMPFCEAVLPCSSVTLLECPN